MRKLFEDADKDTDTKPDGTFDMTPKPEELPTTSAEEVPQAGANGLAAPSNTKRVLALDEKVDARFTVGTLIGSGSFGQVYAATDSMQPGVPVVVKTGMRVRVKDTARMIIEIELMHKLHVSGAKHNPQLYACGQVLDADKPYNYMVMQMLSKSLQDVRRCSTLCSTLWAGPRPTNDSPSRRASDCGCRWWRV